MGFEPMEIKLVHKQNQNTKTSNLGFGHQVVDWLKLLLKLDSSLAGTCAHHRYSNSRVSTQSVLLE